MQIRAYDREYLDDAQRVLGEAFDFGMVTMGYRPEDFAAFFVKSDVSKQLERGNVKYIAGMNGCELARQILEESGIENDTPDAIYLDRSPEYWCGWTLAFCQWYSVRKYSEILRYVPVGELLSMYPTFHEMDVLQSADAIDRKIRERQLETHLKQFRSNIGCSQAELSRRSGVPLRQIQLFEQRQRDINRAASITLLRLSKALYCRMEDLLEW